MLIVIIFYLVILVYRIQIDIKALSDAYDDISFKNKYIRDRGDGNRFVNRKKITINI